MLNLKEFFLKTNKCLETNIIFNEPGSNNGNYVRFTNHLKKKVKMSLEEYYVKHVLKGVKPKCHCGCSETTKFFKGKFNKYYGDHKNKVKPNEGTLNKIKKSYEVRNSIDKLLKRVGLTVKELEKSYFDFIELKKPMSVLSEELFIDFRTIKSYWFKLGLIEDKEAFKRFTLKSKSKWLNKVIVPKDNVVKLLEDNLLNIKLYIKDKNKVTFDEINSLLNIKINKNYLSLFLRNNLNSEEISKINFIKVSQLEINFLTVLKFYFNNAVSSSFELDGKIFDYKLGKKILIELDGEYWHSNDKAIENDKIKNEIAKENGYILVRVSDSGVKDLEFINKLKKIYEKTK
jgi:very-short-patch-repair endonuclease